MRIWLIRIVFLIAFVFIQPVINDIDIYAQSRKSKKIRSTRISKKIKRDIKKMQVAAVEKYKLKSGSFKIVIATAYSITKKQCGKDDGITASGEKVKVNWTLACPEEYPFGTKVKIYGYGKKSRVYVCYDRGEKIKENKFDIYMKTKKQANNFGIRILIAQIIYNNKKENTILAVTN